MWVFWLVKYEILVLIEMLLGFVLRWFCWGVLPMAEWWSFRLLIFKVDFIEEFISFGLDAFLSVCNNGKTRLFLFDYICNGSLTGLLRCSWIGMQGFCSWVQQESCWRR